MNCNLASMDRERVGQRNSHIRPSSSRIYLEQSPTVSNYNNFYCKIVIQVESGAWFLKEAKFAIRNFPTHTEYVTTWGMVVVWISMWTMLEKKCPFLVKGTQSTDFMKEPLWQNSVSVRKFPRSCIMSTHICIPGRIISLGYSGQRRSDQKAVLLCSESVSIQKFACKM